MDNAINTKAGKDRIRVLVVDDHPIVRDGILQLLARETDIEVCAEAASYQGCVEALNKELPDIVIVDISLPGPSGFEVLQHVERCYPDIIALVLSVHDEPFYAERALRAGARGYISKMESSGSIIEAIHCVMRGEIYMSPKMSTRLVKKLIQTGKEESTSMDFLSARELEVFLLIGQGLSTRLICDKLNLSPKTIETHRSHIKKKLGLADGTALVKQAIDWAQAKERF